MRQRHYISFDEFVAELEKFKRKYGHCDMPYAYRNEEKVHIGRVLTEMRWGRRRITSEQRKKLLQMGVHFRIRSPYQTFESAYLLLKAYYDQYGNCDVPMDYLTEDDINLGALVRNIRSGQRKVTPEQKAMLDEIGFIWREHRKKK